MRRTRLLAALSLALCSMGCGNEGLAREPEVFVRTICVERTSISRTIVIPCILEGGDESIVSVSTPASVTGVFVSEGDQVEEGEVLVSLETDGMHAAVIRTAAARVSAARALGDYAQANLGRVRSLLETGAVTIREFEEAEAVALSAAATARLAETGYSQAQSEASTGLVRAPFAGTITRVIAREGNPASGNLVSISGGSVLEATLRFPPSIVNDLKPGLPVFLECPLFEGELFTGSISAVSRSVDPVSGLVMARAQFQDASERLCPGIGCTATIALETEAEAIVVPQMAMERGEDGGWRVAVVEDGRAHFRDIDVGFQDGFMWQVESGLDEGDSLILLGVNTVDEGSMVREAGI